VVLLAIVGCCDVMRPRPARIPVKPQSFEFFAWCGP
jgi:hypothetical protein